MWPMLDTFKGDCRADDRAAGLSEAGFTWLVCVHMRWAHSGETQHKQELPEWAWHVPGWLPLCAGQKRNSFKELPDLLMRSNSGI